MNPEPLKGIVNKNRTDANFFNIGVVHPSEYDWEEQILEIKEQFNRDFKPFVEMDVGKVLGLCKYIKELENGFQSAVKFYKKYRDGAGNLKKYELKVYNKFIKSLPEYKSLGNYNSYTTEYYNTWLFNYSFADVINNE